MNSGGKTTQALERENAELRARLSEETAALRARLEESEETLRAIREGEVDSLLISTPGGERIYTLEGADHTYRILVESMQQGAATLLEDGSIYYSNQCLARMLKIPLQQLIGASIHDYVHPTDAPQFGALVEQARRCSSEGELRLQAADGALIPVYLAFNRLQLNERSGLCLAVTDLTPIAAAQHLAQINATLKQEIAERKRSDKALRKANRLLEAQKEDLQGLAEELQSQAEELKSQAEELQVQSEEMQAQADELQEANQKLEQARTHLEATLQQMPAGVLIAEAPSGRLIMGNAAMERIFRRPFVPTVDLAGYDQEESMHPDSWVMQDHEHLLARALRVGESVTGKEIQILRGDNTHGLLSVSSAPIRDLEGRIIGAIVVLEDITERKRAAEALRRSEERLRFALVGAEAGAWEWDIRSGAIVWSPESYELYGVDPARTATSYADWERNIHPDDLEVNNQVVRDTLERRRPEYRAEFRVLHPRRGLRWILCLGRVEHAPDGTPWRMSGINIDITERKQAEEALALSAWQKTLLADASAKVVAQTTRQGVLDVVVGAARELTRARLAVSGHGYVEGKFLVGAASRVEGVAPCPPGEVFKLQAGGVYVDFVTRGESIRLGDEELRNHPAWWGLPKDHVMLRGLLGARFVDVHGRPTGLIMVSDKEGGGEFAEDDETLLRQFAATTSLALQHIEARTQAQERSEALIQDDRHKDEFLAMLAHELRNPLAPIRNAVQILHLVGTDEQALRRQREVIDRQVTHMARLLDDLLDISRITQGKIVLKQHPLHLNDVLAHAVETTTPLIESRRHTLAVSMPPDDLLVAGDIDRLAQVVGNLLVNAAKYTDEGGRIWLGATREGEEAVIRVRDTGVGIAPEMLPRVFELFAQADRSLARTQGGLGIGLTMVKNLTRMHGGSVDARSAGPGLGSEFIVRLPVLEGAVPMPEGAREPQDAPPRAVPRRILVADDLIDATQSLAEMLELWGNEVRMANDGQAALEVAREYRPEVVLLDIGMPGMDGHEVARRLRQEHGDRMLLVALTGYAQESDRQLSREAGFNQHLSKPIDLEALRDLLVRGVPS